MEKARLLHTVDTAADFADYLDLAVRSRSSHLSEEARRPHREHRRCSKIRYRDRKEAIRALHRTQLAKTRQLKDWGRSFRNESYSYKCRTCMGVHLTSQKPLYVDTVEVVRLSGLMDDLETEVFADVA